MLFDTTFLIDLEREIKRNRLGPAQSFLANNPDVPLHISIVSLGEFAEGFERSRQDACWICLQRYTVLGIDRDTAWRRAQISRELRKTGQTVGDNDLWIGATAIRHGLDLVTANAQHFQRLPGLNIISY